MDWAYKALSSAGIASSGAPRPQEIPSSITRHAREYAPLPPATFASPQRTSSLPAHLANFLNLSLPRLSASPVQATMSAARTAAVHRIHCLDARGALITHGSSGMPSLASLRHGARQGVPSPHLCALNGSVPLLPAAGHSHRALSTPPLPFASARLARQLGGPRGVNSAARLCLPRAARSLPPRRSLLGLAFLHSALPPLAWPGSHDQCP